MKLNWEILKIKNRSPTHTKRWWPLLMMFTGLSLLLGACGSYSEISPYPVETKPQTNLEFSLKKDDFGVFNFARDFLIGKDAGINNKDDKGVVNGTAGLIGDLALALTSWVLEGAVSIRFDWPGEQRVCAANNEFISLTPLAKCATKVFDDIVAGMLWAILSLSLSWFIIKYLLQTLFPQLQSSFLAYMGRVLAVLVLIPLAGLILTIVADLPIKLFLAILGTDTKLAELKVLFDINGEVHKGSIVFATILSLLSILTAIPVLIIGLMLLVRNLALVFWFLLSPLAIAAYLFDETSAFFSQWKNRVISMSVSILPIAGVFKVALILQGNLTNFAAQPFQLVLMMFFMFLLFAISFVIAWRLFNAEIQASQGLLKTAYSVAKGYVTSGLSLAGRAARAPGRLSEFAGEAFDEAGTALFGEEHMSPSGSTRSTGLIGRAFPKLGPWKYSERGMGTSMASANSSYGPPELEARSSRTPAAPASAQEMSNSLGATALSREIAGMSSAMHNMSLMLSQLVRQQQQQNGSASFAGTNPASYGYTSPGWNVNTASTSTSSPDGVAATYSYAPDAPDSFSLQVQGEYISSGTGEPGGVTTEVNFSNSGVSQTHSQPSNWPAPVSVASGVALYPTGTSPVSVGNSPGSGGFRVVPAPNMLSPLNGKLPVYDPTQKKWVHYLAAPTTDGLPLQSQRVAQGQSQAGTANIPPAPIRPVTRVVPAIPQSQPAAISFYPGQPPAPASAAVAIPTLVPLPTAANAAAEITLQPRGATLLSRNSGSSIEGSQVSAPTFEPGTPNSVKLSPATSASAPEPGLSRSSSLPVPSQVIPPVPPVPSLPLPPLVPPVLIPVPVANGGGAELPRVSEHENGNGVNQSQSQGQPLAPSVQLEQTAVTSGLATSPGIGSSSLPQPAPGRAMSYPIPVAPPSPPELGVVLARPRLELTEMGIGGGLLPNPVPNPVPVSEGFLGIASQGSEQGQNLMSHADPVQPSPNLAQLQLELPALPKFAATTGTGEAGSSLPRPAVPSPPPGVNGTTGR